MKAQSHTTSLCVIMLFTAIEIGGCPDTHDRSDAGAMVEVGTTVDSQVPDHASPPPCEIEGWSVAEWPEHPSERVRGCVCPEGTIPGIGFFAPAPLALEHGPFAICIPRRSAVWSIGLCPNGEVLHRTQGDTSRAYGVDFRAEDPRTHDGCTTAEACLFAERQLPEALRGGCLYSDYTIAETATIRRVDDCAALQEENLCGIDCPCGDADTRDRCWGVSEVNPVGLCASMVPCAEGPSPGGLVCMAVAGQPEAVCDIEDAPYVGRYVEPEICEAYLSHSTAAWVCDFVVWC